MAYAVASFVPSVSVTAVPFFQYFATRVPALFGSAPAT